MKNQNEYLFHTRVITCEINDIESDIFSTFLTGQLKYLTINNLMSIPPNTIWSNVCEINPKYLVKYLLCAYSVHNMISVWQREIMYGCTYKENKRKILKTIIQVKNKTTTEHVDGSFSCRNQHGTSWELGYFKLILGYEFYWLSRIKKRKACWSR